MAERFLRRDDDFIRFRPFKAVAAPPLAKDRQVAHWSLLTKLTVFAVIALLLSAALYFL